MGICVGPTKEISGSTRMENIVDAISDPLLSNLAVKTKSEVTAAGVPEMTPVAVLNVNPRGSMPTKEYEMTLPPVTVNVCKVLPAVPTV